MTSHQRFALAAFLIAAVCSSSAQERPQLPQQLVSAPASGHWRHYRIDRQGGTADLYVAHDTTPKPVMILIHGSGCAPVMTVESDGTMRDTTLFQDFVRPNLARLHFAIVDKRGVQPLRFSAGMTQKDKVSAFQRAELACSSEYVQNVTKQNRVEDVAAAMTVLTSQPWVRDVILAGHSEGTHVATGVLSTVTNSRIAVAGLFASAGPIPFFGGYAARGAGDRERFASIFNEVRKLQRADDNVMHEGHPARRWKTFWLDSTPLEDVRESTVPLFVAQGSRDGSTVPADLFTLEAIRQQQDRPLRYVVVDGGGHAFDAPGKSHLAELFDDFVRWALDANRHTSLHVIR